MATNNRMPTYFISHGGGPWPWLDGPYRAAMLPLEHSLQQLPKELPEQPRAILMVSGHWEERQASVMASPRPPMVYDYGGFPEHTYRITYPAPGSPELALRVQSLLNSAGFPAPLDPKRGFDHGAFVPLAVSYPDADMPVVQLSLQAGLDPDTHVRIGRALAPLRDEGILVIGSGLSYHNLRMFDLRAAKPSHEFDAWLQQTLIGSQPQERVARLLAWERAPSARIAHPREEHLLPLMVAVGAAGDDVARLAYHEDDFIGGLAISSFRFG